MDNSGIAPLLGVLVVALVVAAPVVTVAASQTAIPGEALYGLKRATEAITAPSAQDKLDRRVTELMALADRNPDAALMEQTARDIEATIPAVVEKADSLDDIDRAMTGLGEALAQIEQHLTDNGCAVPPDDPGTDEHLVCFGLRTAYVAVSGGIDGLQVARDALALGEQPDERPDVVLP